MKHIIEENVLKLIEESSGEEVGHVVLSPIEGGVSIDETVVNPNYRGQGIAGKLMEAVVDYCKNNGLKIKAKCSYAISYFAKHPNSLYSK